MPRDDATDDVIAHRILPMYRIRHPALQRRLNVPGLRVEQDVCVEFGGTKINLIGIRDQVKI